MKDENISKEELLIQIDKKTKAMIKLGAQLNAITPNVEIFDMFFIAIVNRTVNLNSAFSSLMRNNNFIAAAPLIRINLDSVLRMYASTCSEFSRNIFAEKVLSGERIDRMKNHEGKMKLHDSYLSNEISKVEGMDWVKEIYGVGSSFVHFSDAIIFSSRKVGCEEDRTVNFTIGIHDCFIEESEKFGAIIWMNKIIDAIIIQCQLWMYEKCQKYDFNYEDLNKI
ncbi:hypothetical protein [Lutibacter sp.]|uniref:hypothetical protein n=1 Tax=Lutibacter sp. TaxID=1925666 RepID=UPI0027356F55|nr:hypothetical protein [Lutibacter sp.]MDP3313581.1 hypothetical protein [Lutibacter sp.]